MAIQRAFLFSFSLSVLLLFSGSLAQQERELWHHQRRFRDQGQCKLERLRAAEPSQRIESEAGFSEYFDQEDEQFDCAGVAVSRHTIQPRGLFLPSFSNAPRLVYFIQESFQSFQQSQYEEGRRGQGQQQQQRSRDQHQKIRHFRQGDVIALPAGVSHWCYNDGETPIVAVVVHDIASVHNQLDRNIRKFQLAGAQGRPKGGYGRGPFGQESSGGNIFNGFDVELLAEAFDVSTDIAKKLQSRDERKGSIIRVEKSLQVVRPPRRERESESESEGEEEEEEREREERERERGRRGKDNGLEEAICNMRLKENIGDPERADVYSVQGGHITTLNSQKLPILGFIRMSAERGVLKQNAIRAPHWNVNSHSVIYVTRGSGKVQIVGNRDRPVFNGQLRRGQVLVVPQNFAVIKQAGNNEEFEWVSFKTNDNAMTSQIVGKASALRGMPEEVLMNSYRISREEARTLKNSRRHEIGVFGPGSSSQQGQGGRASE
ncbi:Glutelin type-A 1 [Acorus calamus]|uniref:Glutelin type-A 1 n=1 Tax=Acorus calamus TaxID=4465 RepID=A0AAV9C6J5_ACOCL|nr:Glutelin type-A 1 [Acorus calamus]